MRKIIAAGVTVALGATLTLAGCGGSSATNSASTSNNGGAQATATQSTTKDLDGSGKTETGSLTFYLATPGGTSEGGKVPQVAVPSGTSLMQIEVDTQGGDGTVCTVYIDGIKNTTINAGDTQQSIDLSGDALKEGTHTVELVSSSDDGATIYKKAQYEVVAG